MSDENGVMWLGGVAVRLVERTADTCASVEVEAETPSGVRGWTRLMPDDARTLAASILRLAHLADGKVPMATYSGTLPADPFCGEPVTASMVGEIGRGRARAETAEARAERAEAERDALRVEREQMLRELLDLDVVLPVACGSRVDAAKQMAADLERAEAQLAALRVACTDCGNNPCILAERPLRGVRTQGGCRCRDNIREALAGTAAAAEAHTRRVRAEALCEVVAVVSHNNPTVVGAASDLEPVIAAIDRHHARVRAEALREAAVCLLDHTEAMAPGDLRTGVDMAAGMLHARADKIERSRKR